ncbi:hypothetical protein LXF60_00545, partial [Klebsiella pneumoniae]|nr:hypothetical protein [Klebsiella pneumoniae]
MTLPMLAIIHSLFSLWSGVLSAISDCRSMICPPEILVMHTVILFRRQIKEAAAINFHDSRNMP